jgi:hypothetical protein
MHTYETFEDFKEDLLSSLGGNLVDVELEDKDLAGFYEGNYRFDLLTNQYLFIKRVLNYVKLC